LRSSILAVFSAALLHGFGQAGVTTFGVQIKPIVPLAFFDPITRIDTGRLTGQVELRGGYALGMLVRQGVSPAISIEAGINLVERNYQLAATNDTNGISGRAALRWVGYEIPLLGLVYLRLGERMWMNNALGVSLDAYPSDALAGNDTLALAFLRRNWAQVAVVGNLGIEYRTPKSGYFYLGASYHRPFGDMVISQTRYRQNGADFRGDVGISGTYLTLDLRYFFYEPARPAKPK
jgi:hypothetical protein